MTHQAGQIGDIQLPPQDEETVVRAVSEKWTRNGRNYISNGHREVAMVYDGASPEELEANMALLLAAPDLLACVKGMIATAKPRLAEKDPRMKWADVQVYPVDLAEWEAAIAKAESAP